MTLRISARRAETCERLLPDLLVEGRGVEAPRLGGRAHALLPRARLAARARKRPSPRASLARPGNAGGESKAGAAPRGPALGYPPRPDAPTRPPLPPARPRRPRRPRPGRPPGGGHPEEAPAQEGEAADPHADDGPSPGPTRADAGSGAARRGGLRRIRAGALPPARGGGGEGDDVSDRQDDGDQSRSEGLRLRVLYVEGPDGPVARRMLPGPIAVAPRPKRRRAPGLPSRRQRPAVPCERPRPKPGGVGAGVGVRFARYAGGPARAPGRDITRCGARTSSRERPGAPAR